ncbi:balbiani ring protein 3-like [Diachasma alloeum]|uniref:balbiani ring protein 3-like n=1 Tax=Diachasma alloeum TaxID=454923 RepID=UPI0010FB4FC6|nr:balbiani ring protein 3-like [Diachasma alloeum]
MSCCDSSIAGERFPGTGCCGSSCAGGRSGCLASEPRIRSCMCQENVGCLDRADCGGFRPRGTAATGACPGPCQCAEEEAWNSNSPPKPNCEWLSNFSELRRQWSDHARKNSCKCCNCAPTRRATPCRPCPSPPKPCKSSTRTCTFDERLSGGACGGASCDNDQRSYPGTSAGNSCQPCAPKSILKPRSCCQCTGNYCMCQPMPRNCNCPPPPQVDARADRECSCECPSSPECACPPSERKFPKTKVRCPNARLCCPTPRPQPGPKCNCSKCQPCLPPPCDPCTSTKCRPAVVKVAPCPPEPPCSPCNPTPACCPRPSSPPCAPSRPQTANRVGCMPPCRRPGQSAFHPTIYSRSCAFLNHDDIEKEVEGTGNRQQVRGKKGQCQCGDDGRGCADDCQFCCSVNCAKESPELTKNETSRVQSQCNCSSCAHKGQLREEKSQCQSSDDGRGCFDDCRSYCSVNCADDSADRTNEMSRVRSQHNYNFDARKGQQLRWKKSQCQCGDDGRGCSDDCRSCCSVNCADDSADRTNNEMSRVRSQHNYNFDARQGQQLRGKKSQCQCGDDGRGCSNDCRSCCSVNCADDSAERTNNEMSRVRSRHNYNFDASKEQQLGGKKSQCQCGDAGRGCSDDCRSCCSINCAEDTAERTNNEMSRVRSQHNYNFDARKGQQLRGKKSQCQCGDDGRGCSDDCRSCCSVNCAEDSAERTKNETCRGCAADCQHYCALECSREIHNDTRKRISAGSDVETTRRYSNETGIMEKRNVDELIESNSNTQHSQDSSQLRDLRVVRCSSASATPKRSTRLLQSLMRGKSSKAGVHHQDSNYNG